MHHIGITGGMGSEVRVSEIFLRLLQVMEAEFQYKQYLNDAKIQQNELVKVKERIICHIRKLICQGDSVLKEVGMKCIYINICQPSVRCLV